MIRRASWSSRTRTRPHLRGVARIYAVVSGPRARTRNTRSRSSTTARFIIWLKRDAIEWDAAGGLSPTATKLFAAEPNFRLALGVGAGQRMATEVEGDGSDGGSVPLER